VIGIKRAEGGRGLTYFRGIQRAVAIFVEHLQQGRHGKPGRAIRAGSPKGRTAAGTAPGRGAAFGETFVRHPAPKTGQKGELLRHAVIVGSVRKLRRHPGAAIAFIKIATAFHILEVGGESPVVPAPRAIGPHAGFQLIAGVEFFEGTG
jgi:hypothetical protein